MTPETETITNIAKATQTLDRRVSQVVTEQGSIQQIAIKISSLSEWFRNPLLAQYVWNETFSYPTHTEILEHKGPMNQEYYARKARIDEYPTTIGGRFRNFHEAQEELVEAKKDPRKQLSAEEAVACGAHPDSRVAYKYGTTHIIRNAELLVLLINRDDLDPRQTAEIIERQKVMGLPEDVAERANRIQEEIEKVDQSSILLTDRKAAAEWLKTLR